MAEVELYCGDNRDILPAIETGSVGAAILDPPYGIGFAYGDNRDVAKTPGAYARWFLPILEDIKANSREWGRIQKQMNSARTHIRKRRFQREFDDELYLLELTCKDLLYTGYMMNNGDSFLERKSGDDLVFNLREVVRQRQEQVLATIGRHRERRFWLWPMT